MNDNKSQVDFENNFNRLILSCLNLPLGEAPAEFLAVFEQCVSGLSENGVGIGNVNGYPIFADPDNGIILAAVCGASGVAVRIPAYFSGKIITAGAKDHLIYEGGEQRLIVPYSGDSDAWVITDGTQDLTDIRRGLSAVRPLLAGINSLQASRKTAANSIDVERPENADVLAYLKSLKASTGSGAPDGLHYVFETLPQLANIKLVRKTVADVLTMVHPTTGVIFAFYKNEYLYVRLPEPIRTELLNSKMANGNLAALAVPEIGAAWVKFSAFSLKERSPALLASAHQHAGEK